MLVGTELICLSELEVGDSAIIKELMPASAGYRQKLLALGIVPEAQLEVIRKAPLGDPIEVKVHRFSITLRKKESDIVLLERIKR